MAPDFKVDTGAVSGENVGNREKKDAQSIVPELDEDGNDAEDLSNYPMPDKRVTTHTYKTASGEEFSFQIQWPNSFTEVVDHKWQTFETYDSTKWTTIDLKDQTDEKYYDKDKGVGMPEFFTEGIAELVALNDGSSLTLKNYGSHGATTFQLAD